MSYARDMGMRSLEKAVEIIRAVEKRFFNMGTRYMGDGKIVINGVGKLSAFEMSEIIEAAIAVERRMIALEREKKALEEQIAQLTGTGSSVMIDLGDIASKCYHIKYVWREEFDKWRGLLIPESQKDAFLAALDAETREAFAKGFSQGSNALTRLAAGDMSLLDFEEQARKIEASKKPSGNYK